VAKKVSPGIVDVISQPAYQSGTLEGTGMILSSNGLVLTNNHVIEGTNSVTAKLANGTSTTYGVTVLGTDATHDVALLKLTGATNLTPVPLGNSNTVKSGDAVVALGNANGQDGPPAVVSGHITRLNQSIKASDQGAGTLENLQGMLETNAPIISGDSGGALANTAGQVIGMNTAANSTPNAAGGPGTSMGFAIPINRALKIARQIAAGHAVAGIQIGLPAFLGVTVARAAGNGSSPTTSPQGQLQELRNAANQQNGYGAFGGGSGSSGTGGRCLNSNDTLSVPAHIANVSSGALVSGVLCSVPGNGPGGQTASPAAAAGMTAGSVITSINGRAVSSPAALTQALAGYHPQNTISVTWATPKGQQHTASIRLAAGPAK
jgi:S1-C subfamily serine protease